MSALKDFSNIAIIQTAFIGDVSLALPLAQVIKNYISNSEISLVTSPLASTLVNTAKSVDRTIVFDKRNKNKGVKGILHFSKILRNLGVECIIAPHRSLRTTLITKLAKPGFSVGFDRNAMSFLYNSRITYNFHKHEIDRNFSLLSAFSDYEIVKEYFTDKVEFEIGFQDMDYINTLLARNNDVGNNPVLLAPGSEWNTKRWKEEYYIELVKLLTDINYSCFIIGSKKEEPLCRYIAAESGTVSLAGATSLPQLLYLMTKSKIVITNDSAPTHIAGLAGCPVITIFGPTVPEFGFGPRNPKSSVIQLDELKCRPCRIHGSNKCPIRTHECMKGIKPSKVFEKAKEIMEIR